MSETSQNAGRGPRQRAVEIGVAVATFLFGVIVIIGALSAGIDWGIEGPRAGFFPFYIGLFVVIGSVINGLKIYRDVPRDRLFADWGQLRSVGSVVVPIVIYVILVPNFGIYVSSIVLIAVFMKWLGRFGWGLTTTIAIGLPIIMYMIFEWWFLIPLPKGPIEDFLNL